MADPDEWHASGRLNVGHFTDTFYDVNGVARTLQMQLDIARRNDKRLQVITCAPDGVADPELAARSDVFTFSPIGSFAMPEYPGLALYYPPVLKMLDHCYRQGFTHLHSATPGPVGLVALAAARILRLPIHATYHTAFPQYVMMLTEDAGLEEAMWRYMIWYYNQMDRVYVPSHATGDELAERGIARERIAFYPRGIDTETFTPTRRNGFFSRYDGTTVTLPRTFLNSEEARAAGPGLTAPRDTAQPVRFLYVGRLSREKNLHVLADAYRLVATRAPHLRLVLVGDGPARAELEETLRGLPVTFTGYLTGDDLANAYASSDIFVFPSGTDTFGNVVLEAQASGLPVVVTDKGGPQETCCPAAPGPSCRKATPRPWPRPCWTWPPTRPGWTPCAPPPASTRKAGPSRPPFCSSGPCTGTATPHRPPAITTSLRAVPFHSPPARPLPHAAPHSPWNAGRSRGGASAKTPGG